MFVNESMNNNGLRLHTHLAVNRFYSNYNGMFLSTRSIGHF